MFLTLFLDDGVGCGRAAMTDVLTVEVVVRVPMQPFLVAAADEMAARQDTFLHVTLVATFTQPLQRSVILGNNSNKSNMMQACVL